MRKCVQRRAICLVLAAMLGVAGCGDLAMLPLREQRSIAVRDVSQLPRAPLLDVPPPSTVADPQPELRELNLSLDEAIRLALENSRVVRVLAGATAVASGRTIYDAAVTNTTIDQERGRFDPTATLNNSADRTETPLGVLVPANPNGSVIAGTRTDAWNLTAGLAKTTLLGGTLGLDFTDAMSRFRPGVFPLNPQNRSTLTMSYTQPVLQAAGFRANVAPIVIARINTERSFFQFKNSMQDSVRGVIEAYWSLVFARTDAWARRQQVEQGKAAYDRAEARRRQGLGSIAEVAQTRTALANFKANLTSAEANVIQREAALRNIIGLPPSDGARLVPISPPSLERSIVAWEDMLRLAEENRPDLIELKLILEADEQLLLQARNQALPRVDAVALYRWNGLEGTTPAGPFLSTNPGQFTDWTLGVNFSVPLGLRRDRASLRQQELIIARDQANLDQGLHSVVHNLATSRRNVDQFYELYLSFKEAREAARDNLEQQLADFRAGRTIFLNVLDAITSWGNAVSNEAQAVTQYNTELANLERETGTILESHAVAFFEERYASIGPRGRLARPRQYPQSMQPTINADRYPSLTEPAENVFDLKSPPPISEPRRPPNKDEQTLVLPMPELTSAVVPGRPFGAE